MHFILEGRAASSSMWAMAARRVRSLGRHTTIGEMGLITRTPAQRHHRGRGRSVLYELGAELSNASSATNRR